MGGHTVISRDSIDDTTNHLITYKDPVVKNRRFYWATKRLFDITAAFMALVVLAIPMLIVAVLIYIDDPNGSPLFIQERVGRKGKIFKIYKFRSMVVNAEELLEQLKDLNEADGPAFKIADDPRMTKVGRFIRKTNIDELPQLVNILKGDMSFVGPRPALPHEVEQYNDFQRQRLALTPGLTCYWQIDQRKLEMSFDEWMDLDIRYIYERSWSTDIKLIFKTLKVVIDMMK